MIKYHLSCRNEYLSSTLDYFSMIRSRKIGYWYRLILVRIPTKFSGCMSSNHVITSCGMHEW